MDKPKDRASQTIEAETASIDDCPKIIELISRAFLDDPAWSWAFPDNDLRTEYWRLFIESAVTQKFVFRTTHYEAASVWIPPGGSAFTPEVSENFSAIISRLAGDRFEEVSFFLDQFDVHHPRDQPHFYLGLLGVAKQARGSGTGIALLKHNLRLIDEQWSLPVYLESSNPGNNSKYEALGFKKISRFQAPNSPVVSGMWRAPSGA